MNSFLDCTVFIALFLIGLWAGAYLVYFNLGEKEMYVPQQYEVAIKYEGSTCYFYPLEEKEIGQVVICDDGYVGIRNVNY